MRTVTSLQHARHLANGRALLRSVVLRGLARAFGPPPFDPTRDSGDPGLYGPGSASWRVVGDIAAVVGGVRALLIQLLHPLAMAGVADHSDYRADPLVRLRRTSAYVTTLTFGSTAQALEATRAIRRIHGWVHGTAPDGRPYSADDPHLLAWVSVALTSSFLATDGAFGATPVDGDDADAFVAEQSRGAALLDPAVDIDALVADPEALPALRRGDLPLPMLTDGTLPTTAAELDASLAAFRAELHVNHQGRDAAHFLLWPNLPAPVKAGYLPIVAAALATIDHDARRHLRVPVSRPADAAVRRSARAGLALLRSARGESPVVASAADRVHAA